MLFSSFDKMDSSPRFCFCFKLALLALFMPLSLQTTLGESTTKSIIKCEGLDQTKCAFAVSWSGQRCVLEKQVKRSGEEAFTCRTSEIEADRLQNIVETEQCVEGCGLDRNTLGISSDSLLDTHFTRKLCSSQCYNHCPNVVDLFFNLAAGEGVFLPKLCEAQGGDVRREMSEIKSSGIIAPGPIKPVSLSIAPTGTPRSIQHATDTPISLAAADAPISLTPADAPISDGA